MGQSDGLGVTGVIKSLFSERIKGVASSAIALSSTAIVLCALVIPLLLHQINQLKTDILQDMDNFKVSSS